MRRNLIGGEWVDGARFTPNISPSDTSLKYATHFKRNSQAGMAMVNLPTAGVDYHAA